MRDIVRLGSGIVDRALLPHENSLNADVCVDFLRMLFRTGVLLPYIKTLWLQVAGSCWKCGQAMQKHKLQRKTWNKFIWVAENTSFIGVNCDSENLFPLTILQVRLNSLILTRFIMEGYIQGVITPIYYPVLIAVLNLVHYANM